MIPELGFWGEAALNNLAAWFATYLVYSTVALGAVALVRRLRRVTPEVENALWRTALVLAPAAATARIAVEHLGPSPIGTGPEALAVAGQAGSVLVGVAGFATAVAALLTGRFGRLAARARARLGHRRPVTDGGELDMLASLAEEAGLPLPRLTESRALAGPVAIGKREICLPARGFRELPAAVRRAMLAHELGHLARRDSTWTTAAELLERVFFLQPLHRVARRRLRESSEFAADAFAVRLTGEPEHLVRGLAALARAPALSPAAGFAPGSLLLRRVRRALDGPTSERALPAWVLRAAGSALALVVWLTPAAVPAYDCRITGALPDVASWFLLHL